MSSETRPFVPRGADVTLPSGGLPEVIPVHLQSLIASTGGVRGPIGIQFVAQPELESAKYDMESSDPLMEDEHEVAPGLVYKYTASGKDNGRALWTITRGCAAYCRFCTRGREVGIAKGHDGQGSGFLAHNPSLTKEDMDTTLSFIRQEPGLNEVILSGGDPLTVRPDVLNYALSNLGEMQKDGKLDIVRIGTRLPVHNPKAIKEAHFEAVSKLENPRLMVHINHPAELTDDTKDVLKRFRRESGAVVMSQSVLLKGVNDSVDILADLFSKLAKEGIVPYYLYQNDPVYWARHFTVPLEESVDIWKSLRPRLSGVAATARFVIDVPGGYGKIPLPEGDAWNVDYSSYKDFKGTSFSTSTNM